MFGRNWKCGEASIVAVRYKHNTNVSSNAAQEFVADIRIGDANPIRMTLDGPTIATDFLPPGVGHIVSVLVDEKRGRAKFDKDDPRISFKQLRIDQKDRFDELAAQNNRPASTPTQHLPVFSAVSADALFGVLGLDPTQQQRVADQLRNAVEGHFEPGIATAEPAQRLAKLQTIRDLGLLEDAEYERQRKRILDDI